jgi:hypothetical protein
MKMLATCRSTVCTLTLRTAATSAFSPARRQQADDLGLALAQRRGERVAAESAVRDQPLMRAEQQVLVAETGGDVEHRESGRQPFVQEARAPQGELPGDQGRAQRLGVACLLG